MKNYKKINFKNSTILSKICIGSDFKSVDPSNFSTLLGFRQSSFYLINPFLFEHSLKTGLSLLNSFLKCNFKLIFIAKIDNLVLLSRFQCVCKKKQHLFLQDSDIGTGFLTNHSFMKMVIITLFLDNEKAEIVRKEAKQLNIPVVSFTNLNFNKLSSLVFIGANYTSFFSQNLILTFISFCLYKRHVNT